MHAPPGVAARRETCGLHVYVYPMEGWRYVAQSKTRVSPKAKEFVYKTSILTSSKDAQNGRFFSIVILSCCDALTLTHPGLGTLVTYCYFELT